MKSSGIDFTGLAYLAILGTAGVVAFKIYGAGGKLRSAAADAIGSAKRALNDAWDAGADAVRVVVDSVNPASHDNLVNKAINGATRTFTGDGVDTLGTKLAEFFDPSTVKLAAQLKADARGITLADFQETQTRDDMDAGGWASNGGGAAFGNPIMMRKYRK